MTSLSKFQRGTNMKKTLLEVYADKTTLNERNSNPRNEGIVATLSDIIERESSFENLPNAIHKVHEFHKLWIDRSKVKDEEELERVATMFDACFTMMICDKWISKRMKEKNNE